MSALDHKQTSTHVRAMSAIPPKADIGTQSWDVRFVPKADIGRYGHYGAAHFSESYGGGGDGGGQLLAGTMKLPSFFFEMRNKLFASKNPRALYERYGTRLCAHALNPTMHKTRAANTATFNTASIMLPSTESRLPFEVLIFRRPEIFPVVAQMDWIEKDFALRSASKRSASIARPRPNAVNQSRPGNA